MENLEMDFKIKLANETLVLPPDTGVEACGTVLGRKLDNQISLQVGSGKKIMLSWPVKVWYFYRYCGSL